MSGNRFYGVSLFKVILLVVSIIGIWFLWKECVRRKRFKKDFANLLPLLNEAVLEYEKLTNLDFYFAYNAEKKYRFKYFELRKSIPNQYNNIGLNQQEIDLITQFVDLITNLSEKRQEYNLLFVKTEATKYGELFENLGEYPLSTNQIDAVLHDEDNNLVVAGAGTGKTTTISAKVAYILNKGLALPEELLIISFTKNAVKEMFGRTIEFCSNILDIEKLDVRTFNSFGNKVKRHCALGDFTLAFDGEDDETKAFLQETFDSMFLADTAFYSKAVNFLAFFSRPNRDDFAFKTNDEFIKHERSFKNYTLDGIKVKSKEEMEIGNFFFLFNIKYEYEKVYPLNAEDINYDRGTYRPDFYLSDYNLWHEHYGIDRNGNVPERFGYQPPYQSAKEYYQSIIEWKDLIHEKYQSKLIKTFSYDAKENALIPRLKKLLESNGVLMEKRNPEEILHGIHKSEYYKDFINLIYTFLNLMKANGKAPSNIAKSSSDKRLSIFLDVFESLYLEYQKRLRNDRAIDYNDMINEATFHINNGDFKRKYKYILVDEFQDTSLGRYELLKSLKKANPDAKLYCVGDDWQSIYRFTGSDISIITKFEDHFGYTHQSHILQTYRFNDEILNVTSSFIQKNPSQIQKQLTAISVAAMPSFSFVKLNLQGLTKDNKKLIKFNKIDDILGEIERFDNGSMVFLIGRYNHNQPPGLTELNSRHPKLKLAYYTAHKVKGLTCDYAIVLDVDAGKLGFPSEVADDPILNCLLHEGDNFENAEERRVFYVALTRAKHRNYLMFDLTNPSKLIEELISRGNVENPFTDSVICPKCKGRMVKRQGPRDMFYGCCNYPDCKGTLKVNM